MTSLNEWVTIDKDDQPAIHFENSLNDDQVISGYIPVKYTLDTISYLEEATSSSAPNGRAVICRGSYGSGKSRLCAVIARLFRDGFDCAPLQKVWSRLQSRGEYSRIQNLRNAMLPADQAWRPWLVVTLYAGGNGTSFRTCLTKALINAIKVAGLDSQKILGSTVYQSAAERLLYMVENGIEFSPAEHSQYASPESLADALRDDYSESALDTFKNWFREKIGEEFDVGISSGAGQEAHEIFNKAAENLQGEGYAGIIVVWDEFGFFIEELLRTSLTGKKSLGEEAMSMQNFIELACNPNTLSKKTIFLGFTHVSLQEYGQRQSLNEGDTNRLRTVEDRFRKPSIAIELNVSENEGYHLLSGMMARTPRGDSVLNTPITNLQKIADVMPEFPIWERLSSQSCYDEIAAGCYPLHPLTSAALLLLSEQIAQENRTTFYFLQNRDQGGLAGVLSERAIPSEGQIGDKELVRVHELFRFFEQALKEAKKSLFEDYQSALASFPKAEPLDEHVLQAVLVMNVIASNSFAPNVEYLSLWFCDCLPNAISATRVLDSLSRLKEANALWLNENTEVYSFVGRGGGDNSTDKDLEGELALIPTDVEVSRLLLKYPEVQREFIDLLGEFDLDPSESGIIRRIKISLLDTAKDGRHAIPQVTYKGEDASASWCAAQICLVATDDDSELNKWRNKIADIEDANLYWILPATPLEVDKETLREFIAVRNLIAKVDPEAHKFKVLEGKLTKLRTEINAMVQKCFGTTGLRLGTAIVKSQSASSIPIKSWNDLLPALTQDLEQIFESQLRVRCGTFNGWATGPFTAIKKVVAKILDASGDQQEVSELMGFGVNSQEAAIVDGVLVENDLLIYEPLRDAWLMPDIEDCNHEAIKVAHRFLSTGTKDKKVHDLFKKLIAPPFGIPNGIVPLISAIVLSKLNGRFAIYAGPTKERVKEKDLPSAIADFGKNPGRYQTRFLKLSPQQRKAFQIVGPSVDEAFADRDLRGERFYQKCDQVRSGLVKWINSFPTVIASHSELNSPQRQLVKSLRSPVPPQTPKLADELLAILSGSAGEINNPDAPEGYPLATQEWKEFQTSIGRLVEGVRAPLQGLLSGIADGAIESGAKSAKPEIGQVFEAAANAYPSSSSLADIRQKIIEFPDDKVSAEEIASAIVGKDSKDLKEDDYGKAVGVLEVTLEIKKDEDNRREKSLFTVQSPSGEKITIAKNDSPKKKEELTSLLKDWGKVASFDGQGLSALLLEIVLDFNCGNSDET